jgi:hypothetical protein
MDPATTKNPADPAAFIARWQKSGAAERANYQLFLSELCDVLGVPRPDPTTSDDAANAYVFERAVTFNHGDGTTSTGRIDLYRRQCFVLEAKQGADTPAPSLLVRETSAAYPARKGVARRGSVAWDDAMLRARGQAEQYARALPPWNPPPVPSPPKTSPAVSSAPNPTALPNCSKPSSSSAKPANFPMAVTLEAHGCGHERTARRSGAETYPG